MEGFIKSFNHTRPVRDDSGEIVGSQPSPVRARTQDGLPHNYGLDRDRRLIVSLEAGDLIRVKPERTSRALCITAVDLYAYLVRMQANCATLAKARAKKERKALRLAAQRQIRAEKRLFKQP